MTREELYLLLDIPAEVTDVLRTLDLPAPDEETIRLFYTREATKEGLDRLQALVGDDPHGLKLLHLMLDMALDTWPRYQAAGISREIYAETMKFTSRFLRTGKKETGVYCIRNLWWFWRQLSMVEFRLGCLEYELVEENGVREISLHIPSDADMSPASIDASFAACRAFLAQYYPDWQSAPWCCDSWMMSQALPHLLPEGSNILAFQRRFAPVSCQEDSLGVLDWVFPPHKEVSPSLPENTSLQRRMKAWLLAGNKIGWTKAYLRA